MKIQPLNDRVVVRIIEAPNQTEKGLYLPEGAKEKPQTGTVIAVGSGTRENGSVLPLTVRVGDTVLFPKYSGTEIAIDGLKHLVMREADILGVVK